MTREHILWIALLCLLLAGSTNVSARTITVGHATDADYWTIQEAVDAADPSGGDTVRVMIGIYNENVVVSKSLILRCDDKDRTIIDSGSVVVRVTANNATIRGFTIQGGSTGVQINGNNSTVTDNRIRDVSGRGIFLSTYTTGNTISSNTIEDVGEIVAYGIYLALSNGNTISNNTIKNLSGTHGDYNIYFDTSSSNIVINNTLSSACDYGIYLKGPSTMNHIYHNNILNSIYNGCDEGGNNGWDNGLAGGGNYWSDYTGNDTDGDGIGDTTPYHIGGSMNARDNYPFMKMDGWMDANTTPTPPVDLIPATDSDVTACRMSGMRTTARRKATG